MTPEQIIARAKSRETADNQTPEDVLASVRGRMAQGASGSLYATDDMAPDEAADVVTLAERRGMEFGFAWNQREALQQEEKAEADRRQLMDSSALSQHFSNPARAAVGRDSIAELAEIEQRLRENRKPQEVGPSARRIGQGAVAGGRLLEALPFQITAAAAENVAARAEDEAETEETEKLIGIDLGGVELDLSFLVRAAMGQAKNENVQNPLTARLDETLEGIASDPAMRSLFEGTAESAMGRASEIEAAVEADAPELNSTLDRGLYSGGQSLVQMLPSVLAGIITRNPDVATMGMAGTVYGPAYTRAREEGLSIDEAQAFATREAGIEYATERLPMGALIGDIGSKTPILERFLRYQGREQIGEQLATLGQDFNDWQTLNPDKTPEEFLRERPDAALTTAIATLVASGSMQTGQIALEMMARSDGEQASQDYSDRLDRIREAVAVAPVTERRRQDVAEFIENAGEGETVLLDSEGLAELYQSDRTKFREAAEYLELTDDQIERALNGEESPEVKVSRLLTLPETFEDMRDLAKQDVDTPSVREARIEAEQDAASLDAQQLAELMDFETQALERFEAAGVAVQDIAINSGRSVEEAEALGRVWEAHLKVLSSDGVLTDEEIDNFTEALTIEGPQAVRDAQTQFDPDDPSALIQATEQGYEGEDWGEAAEWLRASQKGLDMSTEGRMARAREVGFDTEMVLYHGTAADFDEFKAGSGWMGRGVYLTPDSETAGRYTAHRQHKGELANGTERRNVMPLYLRGRLAPLERAADLQEQFGAEAMQRMLRDEGYVGFRVRDEIIVFDPSNIRSVNAAFDPDYSDSANLLAQPPVDDVGDLDTPEAREDFRAHEVHRVGIEGGGELDGYYGFEFGGERLFLEVFGGRLQLKRGTGQTFAEPVDFATLDDSGWAELAATLETLIEPLTAAPLEVQTVSEGEADFWESILEGLGETPQRDGTTVRLAEFSESTAQSYRQRLKDRSLIAATGQPSREGEWAFLQSLDAFDFQRGRADRLDAGRRRLETAEGERAQAVLEDTRKALETGITALRDEFGGDRYLSDLIGAMESQADVYALEGHSAPSILQGMREKLEDARDGGALFQSGDTPRASVRIPGLVDDTGGGAISPDPGAGIQDILSGEGEQILIRLGEAADKTTLLHESAHIFLELYAALEDRSPAIAERMAPLREWLKWEKGQPLTREQHEKFAGEEGFELYLARGEAPSKELKGLFRQFRSWFVSIYRQLRDGMPKLDPRAKEFFDRMLATDIDVEMARSEQGLALSSKVRDIMSEEQIAKHEAYARAQGDLAKDRLFKKHLEEVERRSRKTYRDDRERIENEARAELEEQGVYQARAALEGGLQLNAGLVDAIAGEDAAAALSNYLSEDGIDPDMVAPDYGYATGDEMIRALMEAPDLDRQVRKLTKARLDQLHGDMMSDGSAEAEALELMFNDPSIRAMEVERDALAAKAARDPIPLAGIRKRADQLINSTPISQIIKPGTYAIQARTLHRKSMHAAAREQWEDALRYTHQAMLQHELARRAYKAREEIAKIDRYLAKFAPHRKLDPKKVAPRYIDMIRKLHALPGADNQQPVMAELVAFEGKEQNEGFAVQLPLMVQTGQTLPRRRNMTMEQLRDFRDGVKNLNTLGRQDSELERERRKAQAAALAADIRKNYTGKLKRETRNPSAMEKLTAGAREIESLILRYPFLVEALQGGKDGAVVKALEQGLRRQLTARNRRRHDMTKKLVAILDKHGITQDELNKRISAPAIEAGPVKFEQVIALALNMGTQSNRDRIAGDPTLGELADIEALLEQRLEKRHWDAVQDIWNLIGELWPEASAVERSMTGVTPKKVDALPFTNTHGSYAGGYFPISYDRNFLSNKDLGDADMKELWKESVNGMATHAATPKGFLKERQANVQRPLRLSLDNIITHIDDVTNDIYLREETSRISQILRSTEFRAAVSETHGKEYLKTLETVLKRVVHGTERSQDSIERLFRTLRVNASVAILGLNVRTALLAPVSYFQTVIPRYGIRTILDGMGAFYMRGVGAQKYITEKSEFMRERVDTLSREAHERLRNAKRQSTWNKAQGAGYWMMSFIEIWSTSGPTWMGVYRKAIADGKSEQDAVTDADRAVAVTQGSGLEIDQSILQGGSEFSRSLTFMWGYVSGYYGIVRNDIAKADGYKKAWPVVKHLVILNIMAAMVEGLLRMASSDDEEEDPYLDAVQQMYWRNIIGMIPLVSQAANRYGAEAPAVAAGSGLFDSWRAWERAAEEMAETGELEGETAYRATRQTLKSIGIAIGFPGTLQIDKTVNTLVVDDDPTMQELILTGPDDDN